MLNNSVIIFYSINKLQKLHFYLYSFTFAGSVYFERMKELGFYTIDKEIIKKRVEDVELLDIYNKKLLS